MLTTDASCWPAPRRRRPRRARFRRRVHAGSGERSGPAGALAAGVGAGHRPCTRSWSCWSTTCATTTWASSRSSPTARGSTARPRRPQTPLCAPSRAALLTGVRRLADTRHRERHRAGDRSDRARHLRSRMRPAGYRMALVGKYQDQFPFGLGADHVPPGWTDWNAIGSAAWNPGAKHETDHCFQWASDFVGSLGADERFVLWVAPELPDDPFTPPTRYADASVTVPPEPPSVDEADVSTKPLFVRQKPRPTAAELAGYREDRRLQALDMLAIDDGLQRLVGALRAVARRRLHRHHVHERQLPRAGRAPARQQGLPVRGVRPRPLRRPLAGRRPPGEDHAISLVDVPATKCAIAASPPPVSDGVDLSPLLQAGTPVRRMAPTSPHPTTSLGWRAHEPYKYVVRGRLPRCRDPPPLSWQPGRPRRQRRSSQLRDLLQSRRPSAPIACEARPSGSGWATAEQEEGWLGLEQRAARRDGVRATRRRSEIDFGPRPWRSSAHQPVSAPSSSMCDGRSRRGRHRDHDDQTSRALVQLVADTMTAGRRPACS